MIHFWRQIVSLDFEAFVVALTINVTIFTLGAASKMPDNLLRGKGSL